MTLEFIFTLLSFCLSSGSVRPKIIGGQPVGSNELPFVVRISTCDGSGCTTICTGSLVSPRIVLTAASCVRPAYSLPVDTSSLVVELSSLVVSGGPPVGGFSIGVVSVMANTYGMNMKFPNDGDIALLEVERTVVETSVFGLVASGHPEPGTCDSVEIAGYGKSSNSPLYIDLSTPALKKVTETLHSEIVCKVAYTSLYPSAPEETVDGERFMCSGGDSWEKACYEGDLGSPILSSHSDGSIEIIGIVTSMTDCTVGPDYSTRISFYSEWICQILKTQAGLPSKSCKTITRPNKPSRCVGGSSSSQWQCLSGECIESVRVCDEIRDCQDGSDENLTLPNGNRLCYFSQPVQRRLTSSSWPSCTVAMSNVDTILATIENQNSSDSWESTSLATACLGLRNCVSDSAISSNTFATIYSFCLDFGHFIETNNTMTRSAQSFNSIFNISCPSSTTTTTTYFPTTQPETSSSSSQSTSTSNDYQAQVSSSESTFYIVGSPTTISTTSSSASSQATPTTYSPSSDGSQTTSSYSDSPSSSVGSHVRSTFAYASTERTWPWTSTSTVASSTESNANYNYLIFILMGINMM